MSGNSDSVTSTSSLPEWLQGYAQSYVGNAANLANQPFQPYGAQRVAGLNDQYGMANDLITQRAVNGAPDLNAARGSAMNIASGQYLGQNPWFSQDYVAPVLADTSRNMADAFARGTAAQTDAAAARQGAYGGSAFNQLSSLNAGELANQVGQMGNRFRLQEQGLGAQDWQQGVGQMMQAGGLAGQLSQDDWKAAQMLGGAGDVQRQYSQQVMDDAFRAYKEQQQWPYEQLNFFGNALGNASGGQGTTTQTQPGQSLWGNLIGAGLIGGSLWNAYNK